MVNAEEDEIILKKRPELSVFGSLFDISSEVSEHHAYVHALSNCSLKDISFVNSVHSEKISEEDFRAGIQVLDSEFNIAKAILELTSKIEESKNPLLLELCVHVINRNDVIAWIEADQNFSDTRLAMSILLNSTQISQIWNGVLKRWKTRKGFIHDEVLWGILKTPNTPSDVLEDIYKLDYESERLSIAKSKHLNEKLTYLYLTSKRQKERHALASSHYVSDEVILYLTRDAHQNVQNAAKIEYKRRHKLNDVDSQKISDACSYVESHYLSQPPDIPERKTEKKLLQEYQKNPKAWRELAQHPSLGMKVVKQFFVDGLDIFETNFFKSEFQVNPFHFIKILPAKEQLYKLAAKSQHDLVLLSCLIKLHKDKDLDEQLLSALSVNPVLKDKSIPLLLNTYANIWHDCAYYREEGLPERFLALMSRWEE